MAQLCPFCNCQLDEVALKTNVCSSCKECLGKVSETIRTVRADRKDPLRTTEIEDYNRNITFVGSETSIFDSGDFSEEPEKTEAPVVIANRRVFADEDEEGFDPDYDILKKIGEGGMGIVQEAKQESLGRIVAVKLLNSSRGHDSEDHFKSEAAVTGNLEHPNIIPIYDLGVNGDNDLFYTMKRVRGTPWNELLEARSLQENIHVLQHVCDAVAYAHSKGIIHRDLKPENVMLGEFGEILVMDWGLAAGVWEGALAPRVRYEDAIAGTPAYMAPEMARGEESNISFHSDIYLLGAILYEVVTGEPPHTGSSVRECLSNAAKNTIVDPWVDSELLKTARKAMATEPYDRYESVREFQRAISQHTESIDAATRARKAWRSAKKNGSYHDYFRALSGLGEALEIWDGNDGARNALEELVVDFSNAAIENGDLYLAKSLLDESDQRHTVIFQRICEEEEHRKS